MKNILKPSAIIFCASLTSCLSPTAASSADPIGDGFTHAGNAIGKVVNKVIPQAATPALPQYTPTTPQYTIPAQ